MKSWTLTLLENVKVTKEVTNVKAGVFKRQPFHRAQNSGQFEVNAGDGDYFSL